MLSLAFVITALSHRSFGKKIMDDEEYYSKLRRQYTNPLERKKKNGSGKYSSWAVPHGREDAEMLEEREMTDSKTDDQFSGED